MSPILLSMFVRLSLLKVNLCYHSSTSASRLSNRWPFPISEFRSRTQGVIEVKAHPDTIQLYEGCCCEITSIVSTNSSLALEF